MAKRINFQYRGGELWIVCPQCNTEQILPENDRRQARGKDGYDVDRNGVVKPEWICMARPDGAYCNYSAHIELRDY